MRESIKSYVTSIPERIRANLWFVMLSGFILIAAGLSLSYAFLREDPSLQISESSLQVPKDMQTPKRMNEVATLDESGSDTQPRDSTATSPSNGGATLGDSVNCTLENEKFGMPVELHKGKLKQATLQNAETLYREFERLYTEYRANIEARGCAPNIKLPYTLGELLQSLR